MTDLTHLIERCESGEKPSRLLDREICCAILDASKASDWWNFQAMRPRGSNELPDREYWKLFAPRFTASLDAVVSLIEQKLPGWGYGVSRQSQQSWATLTRPANEIGYETGAASSPSRALLAATLRAFSALEASKAGLADANSKGDHP